MWTIRSPDEAAYDQAKAILVGHLIDFTGQRSGLTICATGDLSEDAIVRLEEANCIVIADFSK